MYYPLSRTLHIDLRTNPFIEKKIENKLYAMTRNDNKIQYKNIALDEVIIIIGRHQPVIGMKNLAPILFQIVFCDSIYRMHEAIYLSLNNNVGTQLVNDILFNILGQNWHL